MELELSSTLKLNSGAAMPRLGLGVYQLPDGEATTQAVTSALAAGYRHVDTAKLYKNEDSVGQAIRESSVPREELWVTTKLWPTDLLHVQRACELSLQRLGLDYVDLYLIHFPVPGMIKTIWKSMESLSASGLARSIGVSNFSAGQVASLLDARVPPSVNQVKVSAFGYNRKTYEFCQKEGVAVEAYSPLHRGKGLDDPRLVEIAARYHKTPAQVLLRWALQKDMIVIPKSQSQSRIDENADVYDFSIDEPDMALLEALSA
jgi:diketogulonate reductase-like aldo/keto reductase